MHYGTKFGTRHFHLQKQVDFISGHGAQCVVTPTIACACVTYESQFDPLCDACRGTGRWPQPSLQFTATLLLTRYEAKQDFHEPGAWVTGGIQATSIPGLVLPDRALVEASDLLDTFTDEVLQRDVRDQVRFRSGVVLSLIRDRTTLYTPDVDYALTPPNTVTWLAGGVSPPTLTFYSVVYQAHPEYLVFLLSPKERVEHRVNLAQVVTLMRLDHFTTQR